MSLIERERRSLAAHRATLQGSSLPPPKGMAKGTFTHGFLLPFSLIAATIRDRELRGPYLRVALVRSLLLALVGVIGVANGSISSRASKHPRGIVIHAPRASGSAEERPTAEAKAKGIHVDVPGLHVDIDQEHAKGKVSFLGQDVPVSAADDGALAEHESLERPSRTEPPPNLAQRIWLSAGDRWAWVLALLAFLSATEGAIVLFSRRWDDWLSFHASRLAEIRPEDETPKTRGIGFDVKWLFRKLKRRARGYIVFGAGLPVLAPLRLLPTVGPWAFTLAATLWGWYWLGIFSAAKSAHAWADEATAPSPFPIRELSGRVSRGALVAPVRMYARVWARLTRGMNPAAATFERSAAAFLGLALARVFLSLPGVYFLARPIVPVAAGRLCAESDPADRFSTSDGVPTQGDRAA